MYATTSGVLWGAGAQLQGGAGRGRGAAPYKVCWRLGGLWDAASAGSLRQPRAIDSLAGSRGPSPLRGNCCLPSLLKIAFPSAFPCPTGKNHFGLCSAPSSTRIVPLKNPLALKNRQISRRDGWATRRPCSSRQAEPAGRATLATLLFFPLPSSPFLPYAHTLHYITSFNVHGISTTHTVMGGRLGAWPKRPARRRAAEQRSPAQRQSPALLLLPAPLKATKLPTPCWCVGRALLPPCLPPSLPLPLPPSPSLSHKLSPPSPLRPVPMQGRGPILVARMAWSLLAWAGEAGVRVYDTATHTRVGKLQVLLSFRAIISLLPVLLRALPSKRVRACACACMCVTCDWARGAARHCQPHPAWGSCRCMHVSVCARVHVCACNLWQSRPFPHP